jgi:drug/metabolite transporter (DMT)-like permease
MATLAPGAIPADGARDTTAATWRIDVLLFLMALIWAVNYSVLKYGTQIVAPLAYNGARIPVAALFQLVLVRAMRVERITWKDARTLILLGMLGNGLYQLLFIVGVARTRVATTVLILASGPALVAVLGWLRSNERLTRRAWAGIALQLAGVACVVLGTAGSREGTDSLVGGLLVLGGAISWAYFSVLVKPLSERLPALQIGAYTMVGGALVTVTAAVPGFADVPWGALPWGVYGALLYSSVGALVIAYLIWYRGVRTIGPVRTSMYSNLQPVLAMAVAWLVLSEMPSVPQVAGAAAIMGGLVVARPVTREPEAP